MIRKFIINFSEFYINIWNDNPEVLVILLVTFLTIIVAKIVQVESRHWQDNDKGN